MLRLHNYVFLQKLNKVGSNPRLGCAKVSKSKTYGFDIWQFLNMIHPLKEKYELRGNIDKNIVIQEAKDYDHHEMSYLSFIIANVYNLIRFPYMGHSIEIWGKK